MAWNTFRVSPGHQGQVNFSFQSLYQTVQVHTGMSETESDAVSWSLVCNIDAKSRGSISFLFAFVINSFKNRYKINPSLNLIDKLFKTQPEVISVDRAINFEN